MFEGAQTLAFHARTLLLAVLVAGAAWAALRGIDAILPSGLAAVAEGGAADALKAVSRVRLAVHIGVAGLAGVAAYAVGAWLLRLEEPRLMLQWTVGKALAKVRGRAARR